MTNERDELRRLLLEEEQQRIDAVSQLVSDELRDEKRKLNDLTELLPKAIQGSKSDQLARAMAEPVGLALQTAVRRDPKPLADALFPIIGPAIRKAISESLKGFVDSINRTIEASVSPKSIGWRIQAMRTGTPFAEIVLKNTLAWRVSRALLIDRDTGLLIAHVDDGANPSSTDSDAVSGMLTAVQDFVRDAFSSGNDDELATVDMGDYALWIQRGPAAMLAAVVHGVAPGELRNQFQETLETIHLRFAEQLDEFNGDREPLQPVTPLLDQCLLSARRGDEEVDGGKGRRGVGRWLLLGLLMLGCAGALYWYLHHGQTRQPDPTTQWLNELSNEPGIVILDRQTNPPRARLLVDPTKNQALEDKPDNLTLSVMPFHSLDPTIVMRRARSQLMLPDNVRVRLDDGVLHLAGDTTTDLKNRLENLLVLPAGVDRMDTSQLAAPRHDPLSSIRKQLRPPTALGMHLTDGTLYLAGEVRWPWLELAREKLASNNVVKQLNIDNLSIAEWTEAASLKKQADTLRFMFIDDVDPDPTLATTVAEASQILERLAQLDDTMPMSLTVNLIGHSDGTGTPQHNLQLRLARATYVRDALIQQGIPAHLLRVSDDPDFHPADTPDPEKRRVLLSTNLRHPQSRKP